eukprot:363329-Chlamydomonas_euryale.AAC.7
MCWGRPQTPPADALGPKQRDEARKGIHTQPGLRMRWGQNKEMRHGRGYTHSPACGSIQQNDEKRGERTSAQPPAAAALS